MLILHFLNWLSGALVGVGGSDFIGCSGHPPRADHGRGWEPCEGLLLHACYHNIIFIIVNIVITTIIVIIIIIIIITSIMIIIIITIISIVWESAALS